MTGLFNEDIGTVLGRIDDASVDLVIADPPYFEIVEADWDHQWPTFDDYERWLDGVFAEFSRVLKPGGACYVYSSITHYPRVQLCLNRHLDYAFTITWKKQRGRGRGWGFNREEVCVNTKGPHAFKKVESQTLNLPHLRAGKTDYSNGRRTERKRDYKLASSVWDDVPQVCSYRKQLTLTEKPVELARRFIRASSEPGDLILVAFVGSGSEVEACIALGREYIGAEKDESAYRIASRRIADERPFEQAASAVIDNQGELFA